MTRKVPQDTLHTSRLKVTQNYILLAQNCKLIPWKTLIYCFARQCIFFVLSARKTIAFKITGETYFVETRMWDDFSGTNFIEHNSITVLFEIKNPPRQSSWNTLFWPDFTAFYSIVNSFELDFGKFKTRQFLAECTTVRRGVVTFKAVIVLENYDVKLEK